MREAGLVMVRYADDAVVLCRNEEAQSALTRLRAWVVANELTPRLTLARARVRSCQRPTSSAISPVM